MSDTAEEEQRGGSRRDGSYSEHREKEEAVSEVIHGGIRLSVSTACSCNVNGDDRTSDQECDKVSDENRGDLDSGRHGVTTLHQSVPMKRPNEIKLSYAYQRPRENASSRL